MAQEKDKIDIDALLNEVIEGVETMIKSEKAAKSEESSKEKSEASSKKEESSMAKDEPPSVPAPEASKPEGSSPVAPAPEEEAPAEAQPEQEGEHLEDLVQSLDDDMLQELLQVVQMEIQARQGGEQQPEESTDVIPPAQEASEQMSPAAPAPDMAMKSEIESLKNLLAKTEEKFQNLQASVLTITETVTKAASMPRPKAVTEIKDVQVVDRGESLNKGEGPTKEQILQKMTAISKDFNKMKQLNKSELNTLQDFFHTKQVNEQVLQLFNK